MSASELVRISLDLETMSLEPNAAIVQIGAVCLNAGWEAFVTQIDPREAEKNGGHVDVSTMEWWGQQDKEVREAVFSGVHTTTQALIFLDTWLHSVCPNPENLRIYTKGYLDAVWLAQAYERVGMKPPHYRSPCDLRTVKDVMELCGLPMPGANSFKSAKPHDALCDAMAQANLLRFCFSSLESACEFGNNEPRD